MIYGVGAAGRQLANAVENSIEMRIVGFLDDDEHLHGKSLNGLPIYNPRQLKNLALNLQIEDVFQLCPM